MMEEQIENIVVPADAPVLPGAMLREARERLGLSVADAAAQTKLAPRQIEALEADDYQRLPEMAFVRGFVRSYARVLQLDAQPLLAALPQAKVSEHVSPSSVEVPFPDARSPQLQNLIWLGAALFLSVVVVAVAVWNFTSPGTPEATKETAETAQVETALPLPAQMEVIPASAVTEAPASSVAPAVAQSSVPAAQAVSVPVAPVATVSVVKQPLAVSAVAAAKPAAAQPVPAPAVPATKPVAPAAIPAAPAVKPATPAAKPLPPAAPATKPQAPVVKPSAPAANTQPANLRLTFGEESWTEVRDRNGNIVSSQLNPAGSELRLSGQGPFTLVVGRASSARLTYKGKTVDMKSYTNATSDVARLSLE